MDEFWKFIFGQGMFTEPKDDGAQIKRDAAKKRAYLEGVEKSLAQEEARRASEAEAYAERRRSVAEFNAYLDRRQETLAKPEGRGWKANRKGQQSPNRDPAASYTSAQDRVTGEWSDDTFLPPSYYTDRDLPVPSTARELPDNAVVSKRYVAENPAQPRGGPN